MTTLSPLFAQTTVLSRHAVAVKQLVESLPIQAEISVIPRSGLEEFGTLVSHTDGGFTFHDVDRAADVTLSYEAVKKVKRGYGGYNHVAGRHVDRRKALIITVVVVGVLAGVIGAAAAAK